jgi:predicted O-methyltransferase YrrM
VSLKTAAKSLFKHVVFSTPLHRSLYNQYPFMFSPTELMYLAGSIGSLQEVPGSIVEAGCAYGATTVWLNQYMDELGIDRSYYALDTFSGFAPDHIEYESAVRLKSAEVRRQLTTTFADNRQSWFDKQMQLHNIQRVHSIQCDVGEYDFGLLAPIAFCLLDVDLYLPIKSALPRIYDALALGGMIIVDDCWADEKWNGALQAYEEFTFNRGLERRIVSRKLGVISRGT